MGGAARLREKRREMKRGSNWGGGVGGKRVSATKSSANKASLLFITMAAYSNL